MLLTACIYFFIMPFVQQKTCFKEDIMEPERANTGALIKRISEMFDKKANSGLAEYGITVSQMKLLVMIKESRKESVALKELERYFDLTQATIAGLVIRLEKKGFVTGFADPADKRIKRVMITDEGMALCRDSKAEMVAYEDWLLQSLNEEEKALLGQLLAKVYRSMQEALAQEKCR